MVKIGAGVDGVVVVVVGIVVAAVGVGIAFCSGGALVGCPGVGFACARGGGRLLLRSFCWSERGIALGLEGLVMFLTLGGSDGGRQGGWGGVPVMVIGGATRGAARGPGKARGAA